MNGIKIIVNPYVPDNTIFVGQDLYNQLMNPDTYQADKDKEISKAIAAIRNVGKS